MIVSEEIAKRYLARYGLPVPYGEAVVSAVEARQLAESIGRPVVVKALVPVGGRGKAGGVQLCRSPQEAAAFARSLLGQQMLGHPVERVLVEEAFSIAGEIYAGVFANSATAQIDLILSFSGGMEIEVAASQDASAVHKLAIEPGDLLPVHRAGKWLSQIYKKDDLDQLALILVNLHRAAADLDAMLLEINPLALTAQGNFILLDCKLAVDDNALARHPELNALYEMMLDEKGRRARELDLSYVSLDGNIGVLTSGAGLGMMTIDQLQSCGLSAANFLDTGGGISESQVRGALSLIFDHPGLAGVIINLYGGINRMLEAAKGITSALEMVPHHPPLVVKIIGNQQEEAWALLETQPDVHVIRTVQTEAAVGKLAELVRQP
jgi:succinyl-CoA synthetase beta subunit